MMTMGILFVGDRAQCTGVYIPTSTEYTFTTLLLFFVLGFSMRKSLALRVERDSNRDSKGLSEGRFRHNRSKAGRDMPLDVREHLASIVLSPLIQSSPSSTKVDGLRYHSICHIMS